MPLNDEALRGLRNLKALLGTDSPEVRGWAPAVQQAAQRVVNVAIRALQHSDGVTVCACGAGALGMGHHPECQHGALGGPDAYARELAAAGGRSEPDDLDREAARIMTMPEGQIDDELRALGIDPATAAQKARDAIAGALAQAEAHRARCGGYVCGMCGQDTPHQHTPEEIVIFRNGIKRGTVGAKG